MAKSKIISLVFAISVVIRFYLARGMEGLASGIVLSLVALVLIWFPRQVNDLARGFSGIRSPKINRDSPGWLIAIFGWALLALISLLLGLRFGV